MTGDSGIATLREWMKTVVCLPTKNEALSIARMIRAVRAVGLDLFVIDEHSTDETAAIAASLGVAVHQRDGSGKGWAVRKALEVARQRGDEVLVLIDCDCTYAPDDIPRLLQAMEGCETAIGYRPMRAIAWSHRVVNHVHTGAINLLFDSHLHDINSGLRALRVRAYAGLLTATGFDIEAQMTSTALRRRWRVAEVPISYCRRVGRSKIRAWDTLRILRRIVRERFRKPGVAFSVLDRSDTTSVSHVPETPHVHLSFDPAQGKS